MEENEGALKRMTRSGGVHPGSLGLSASLLSACQGALFRAVSLSLRDSRKQPPCLTRITSFMFDPVIQDA